MAVVESSVAAAPMIPTVKLPSSFDSMLGSLAAAEQAIARVAADIKVMVEAQARSSSDFSRALEENKKVMQSLDKAVQDSVQNQRVAFETVGRAGRSISETGYARDVPNRAALERDAFSQAQSDYQRAQRQPFSTMRENMFGSLAENLSSRQQGFVIDSSGRVRTEGGQFVASSDAERIQSLEQRKELAQLFAESGAKGAIMAQFPQLAGILKFATATGVVVGGANIATGRLESEREAARQYQRALGVSNIEAQGQRLQQFGFRTSMMGTMGDAAANRLFDDVTAMGMTGGRRTEALGFATSAFREFGMETADSVALVRAASRRGTESFEELTKALRGVTEAAAQSGISADSARQSFTSLYTSMSSQIGQSGAIALSQGLATAGAQLGPSLQGIDFTGTFNEDQIRRMAAAEGVSYGEMLQVLNDPLRAPEVLRGRADRSQQALGSLIDEPANERFAELLGGRSIESLTNADFDRIGGQMMDVLPDPSLLRDVYEFQTGISTAGLSPQLVAGLVLREIAGTGQLVQLAGGMEADVAAAEIFDVDLSSESRSTSRFDSEKITEQLFADYDNAFERGNRFTRQGQEQNREVMRRKRLADQYSRSVAGRGGVGADPIVARLIAESSAGDMFEVSINGQRRIVDLQTLVTQFPDKILDGSAIRASGSRQGENLGRIYGFGSREVPEELMASLDVEGRASLGSAFEDSLAAMGEGGAIAGRVFVSPTPELARWLEVFSAGTANEQASRNAIVPNPSAG